MMISNGPLRQQRSIGLVPWKRLIQCFFFLPAIPPNIIIITDTLHPSDEFTLGRTEVACTTVESPHLRRMAMAITMRMTMEGSSR